MPLHRRSSQEALLSPREDDTKLMSQISTVQTHQCSLENFHLSIPTALCGSFVSAGRKVIAFVSVRGRPMDKLTASVIERQSSCIVTFFSPRASVTAQCMRNCKGFENFCGRRSSQIPVHSSLETADILS